jgi:1-acyl-sn-glycerol-3-phosphate acyltransferase
VGASTEVPTAANAPGKAADESVDLDVFEPDELGIGSRVVPFGTEFHGFEDELDELLEPPHGAPSGDSASADVEEQIRALEARLDGMIRRASTLTSDDDETPPPSIREQVGSAAREVVERLAAPLPIERPGTDDGSVVDAARELFSSKYYLRQWGRIGMRNRSEDVDEFGLDPTYEERILPIFDFLYKRYFRIETFGIEHIPNEGRCIVVANHAGTLPLDGPMLRTACRLTHPGARELRWLAEDFIFYLPFVGAFMNRIGAVRACQENAERLLGKEALLAVFPEGVQGIRKLYKDRYQLQRFGRGGFIRLCLRTQTPLVPCAVVGAEEASPMVYRIEYLSKALGLPYLPITPTFPALGPIGLLPAPSKWRIYFGEPMRFDGYGPGAADDHVLVGRLAERVRAAIQGMLDHGLHERKSVWFG